MLACLREDSTLSRLHMVADVAATDAVFLFALMQPLEHAAHLLCTTCSSRDAGPVLRAENVFISFFKEAAATGKLRVPSMLASDEIPLIAGADVAGAAAAVLQDFDAYAGQVASHKLPVLLGHPRLCVHMPCSLCCTNERPSPNASPHSVCM